MYAQLAKHINALPLSRFAAAIARFKSEYLKTLAPSTQPEYERLLDLAADDFADFEIADVRPTDIARSVKNLYAGRPTAARSYKARLSTFFRWCVEEGLCSSNPCREIWLKAPPKRDRYIGDDELGRIRAWLLRGDDGLPTPAGEMARIFVELCYLTIQRPTDIRRLMWSQVREDGIAFKPTKTAGSSGAKVVVPLTPALRDVLERARAFRPAKRREGERERKAIASVYVVRTIDGSPYTMSGIRSAWQRACRRAKVENATIKDLRAKALTDARRAGYDLNALQLAAAHSSVTTTEGYVRRFDEPVSTVQLALPALPTIKEEIR